MPKKIVDYKPAVPTAPMTDHAERHNAEADAIIVNVNAIAENTRDIANFNAISDTQQNKIDANTAGVATNSQGVADNAKDITDNEAVAQTYYEHFEGQLTKAVQPALTSLDRREIEDREAIAENATNLVAENDARVAEDTNLQEQIDNIQSSGYDDSALKKLITDEESARVAEDTSLQGQIDAIETYDPVALEGKVDANALAISQNATSIVTENSERLAEDTNLQNQIDNIQSSGYDDTALKKLITDETTSRVTEDADLQDQIDAIETYDPTALQAQVDANTLATEDNATEVEEIIIPAVRSAFQNVYEKIGDNEEGIADNAKSLADFTTATLTLANPEDVVSGKAMTISTQEDANSYFDNITKETSAAAAENHTQIQNLWTTNGDRKTETEANALAITTKFSMGSTWGQLAGRS